MTSHHLQPPDPGPITGADGVTFEIAWDDDGTFVPVVAADRLRPGQRTVYSPTDQGAS